MFGNKLINTMQQISKMPSGEVVELVYGEVISVSPLLIKVDQNLILDDKFLLLSCLVRELTINLPGAAHQHGLLVNGTLVGDTVTTEVAGSGQAVIFWRGLEVSDMVRMIRLNAGQLYYVIEREGELSDT